MTLYTQLINFESDEFHSATAKTIVEAGFEYVFDSAGSNHFKKAQINLAKRGLYYCNGRGDLNPNAGRKATCTTPSFLNLPMNDLFLIVRVCWGSGPEIIGEKE